MEVAENSMTTVKVLEVTHNDNGNKGYIFEHVWQDAKDDDLVYTFGFGDENELAGEFLKKDLTLKVG